MELVVPRNIHKLRKIFVSENKGANASLIVQHCLISLYNPATQSYREWDMNEQTEWIVKIGQKTSYKYEVRIFASYNDIENIAKYIVTGH